MTERIAAPSTRSAQTVIGQSTGQPALSTQAGARSLGAGASVLPELSEAPARERPWWRHPAFIVSMVLTLLALAGAAAWFVIAALTDDSVRVSGLSISIEGGNAHLDWGGPDAEYALYAVDADGSATDLTQLVRGTEAWLPAASPYYDDATCFVVRPAAQTGEVTLDAAAVESQRGAATCVADAAS